MAITNSEIYQLTVPDLIIIKTIFNSKIINSRIHAHVLFNDSGIMKINLMKCHNANKNQNAIKIIAGKVLQHQHLKKL